MRFPTETTVTRVRTVKKRTAFQGAVATYNPLVP